MAITWSRPHIKTFFEDANYLGFVTRTVAQLKLEGLESPNDLVDFDKKSLETVCSNLRKPGKTKGRGNVLVDQEPFFVSAKSIMRLTVALEVARYYETVGRPMDVDNMTWTRMKSFDVQWKALKDRKDSTKPDIPKLTKGLSVPKWIESFKLYCRAVIGARGIPIIYLLRETEVVDPNPPALAAGEPHSDTHGSVEDELIARASHSHALCKVDLGTLFDALETALRSSSLMPTISPHRKGRQGKVAFFAVVSQHAGRDVWEAMIENAEDFLKNRKWNGTTNVTLMRHMGKHRDSYIKLVEASEHVPHECPNERTRVTYLLASITCKDPEVLAAVAAIRQDEADKRSDFENAVAYLAPVCPVHKKQSSKGKHVPQAEVSSVGSAKGGRGGSSDLPVARGRTGIELRYHKPKEYKQLTKDQQQELREYRAESKRKLSNQGKNHNKKMKALVASAIAEQAPAFEATAAALQGISAALAGRWAPPPSVPPQAPVVSSVSFQDVHPHAYSSEQTDDAKLTRLAEVAALKLKGIVKKKG